ncbi:MAG: class I SAM-dependent methyltransferase [Nitrospira sp.]|nr:class I SAM-dependent methyltransferase [Nitrospira sp.]MCP9441557.1 class I SAM-dependent methyltransferase [Nitrospira sp.]
MRRANHPVLQRAMGFYSDHIFPRLMDWLMATEEFRRLRSELLAPVHGEVLELGFGTGLNLRHYPPRVARLHTVDPCRLLPRRVAGRIAAAPFPVRFDQRSAETLPYGDRSFDFVVSTWTLCTIADPVKALREVGRVLKPEGYFLFLEHGLSDDPNIAAWQHRLNPIQNVIGCGCNLNRRIDRLIQQSGLRLLHEERFEMEGVPRIAGTMYRGRAAGQLPCTKEDSLSTDRKPAEGAGGS